MSFADIWYGAPRTPIVARMLYALIAWDCSFAVDLYVSRAAAERALSEVLDDEPDFRDLLEVVLLDGPRDAGAWSCLN